jgi:hypothetical protein
MTALKGQINVSVANLYRQPTYISDVVTQAILAEEITILERQKSFSFVQLPDMYKGWLSNYQWIEGGTSGVIKKQIRSHHLLIYDKPDESSVVTRDAVLGTNLVVKNIQGDWSQVLLPDGVLGWLKSHHFGTFPELNRDAVVNLAEELLGYPYFWGGRSVKGLDCSGFTQTVYSLLGKWLPRDSWMQQNKTRLVKTDPVMAIKADLYFFAELGEKITHVGIALGNGKIIHARGMVRINSLKSDDDDYCHDLAESLVDVRTVF